MWLYDSILLQKNIIYVVSYLDDAYSKLLFSNLIYLNFFSKNNFINFYLSGKKNEEKNQIIRFKNLLTFYDLTQQSKKSIKTYTIGLSYDEIMLIGALGQTTQRYSILNSCFGLTRGTFSFTNIQTTDFIKIKSEIIRINFLKSKILNLQTYRNLEKTLTDIENDLLFNSFDAINYGIIDEII
uniref:Clp protease n=1 Tax=Lotharella vacuolata TaxID=74820 RepID=A0A0H5BK67_9EUKA|nr:clp protease [Lotharella vacuolata]